MRENKLVVFPFDVITFITVRISKRANEHATAYIEGYISAEQDNEYVERHQ